MLGFTNNILQNLRVDIHNLWLCNPPKQIYQDIRRNFSEETIDEHPAIYPQIELDALKKMATDFDSHVIGQSHVIKTALSAIYGLRNPSRKRPVTLLFLGDSGIGKTATASERICPTPTKSVAEWRTCRWRITFLSGLSRTR